MSGRPAVLEKELNRCTCGGKARYRYGACFHWVECKKCGKSTGYYKDISEPFDPAVKDLVVKAWNKSVKEGS